MSAVRLPRPPSALPALAVDPALVDDAGLRLRAACARIDDLGTFAAGPGRLDDWSGSAAQAYRSTTGSIGRAADALSLGLRRVAVRVLEHADTLTSLARRHTDLARTGSGLAGGIEVLRHDIARATPDRIVELAPVLQARSDVVAAHVATYEADRRRWLDDLAREEGDMVAVFARLLDPDRVQRRFGGVPDPADRARGSIPPLGSEPAVVRAWWRALTPAQRAALLVAAPGLVGNLGGIPALVRHRANAVRLARDLARLRSLRDRGQLTVGERTLLRNAEAAADALGRAGDVTDRATGAPVPALLYHYDPAAFGGDGAVAVFVGDPGVAADVSVLVPGMSTDAADIGGLVDHAADLFEAARGTEPSATHASLAWIGYDAPDNLPLLDGLAMDVGGVVGEGMAERGGERLADAVEGLRAERGGPPADLTVIGHSYGSTTVGHAAHDHGLPVDDLVVVGSPGLGGDVDHATDLGLPAEHVWAGADSRDLVTDLAGRGTVNLGSLLGLGLGDDPVEDDFGATRFRAESTDRGWFADIDHHDRYFDPDTESLHNIAAIVAGRPDLVQQAAPVSDPWWGPPRDPEQRRDPTAPSTHSTS